MAENNKMAFYVGTFVFLIVGYFIALFVQDFLYSNFPSEPILEIFTLARISATFSAIVWFSLLFVVYWGSTLFIDYGERTGLISITFFITLLVATFALVIASVIYRLIDDSTVTLNLDFLLDSYFGVLKESLAPAIAATFAYSNKSK